MKKRNNKLKRQVISAESKTEILEELAKGEGSKALGREFGLNESTIRAKQKHAGKINTSSGREIELSKYTARTIQKRAGGINTSSNCSTIIIANRTSYSRNISPEKNTDKNDVNRRVISLETKIEILERLAKGEGSTALGREFGLGESTVRGIQKRADRIIEKSNCSTNESAKRSSYSKNISVEKKTSKNHVKRETKTKILERLANSEESIAVGREYGLCESNVRGIQKRASEIKTSSGREFKLSKYTGRTIQKRSREINTSSSCRTNEIAKRASYSRNISPEKNTEENSVNRKVISLETKIEILERLAQGEGSTALGREYGLSESTVRGIRKRADRIKIKSNCRTNDSNKRSSYSKNISVEKNTVKNHVKRKVISLETKSKILERLANGAGSIAVGREFGLCESTVRGIQKRAFEINTSSNCSANESADRNILVVKVEMALILWIQESLEKGIAINKELIKEKAIRFYNQLNDLEPYCSSSNMGSSKFSASNDWLTGFFKRHALDSLKIFGETAFADGSSTKNYSKVSENFIEDDDDSCEDPLMINKSLRPCAIQDSFSENDLFETINNDEASSDNDTISNVTDISEPEQMTADSISVGLQLCHKLESHFLAIDTNSERSLKFQKELQSCLSVYRDIYKRLIKQQSTKKFNTVALSSSSEENDF